MSLELTKRKSKSKLLTNIIICILAIVIVFCLFFLGNYYWNSYQNKTLNDELKTTYYSETSEGTTGSAQSDSQDNRAQFQPLLKINPDVVGWVKIANTRIDYPVVQASDNEYYLDKNIYKKDAIAGSIFMDYRNKGDGSDKNMIIYGHYVKDGSMFRALQNYKDEAFYKTHPVIEFTSLEDNTEWEIFSIYVTDTDFYYIQTDFNSEEEYSTFLINLQTRSLYDTGVEVDEEDQILTLSTCTYEFNDARFTIHAKRVN